MHFTKLLSLSAVCCVSMSFSDDMSSKFANMVKNTTLTPACQNKLVRIVDKKIGKKNHRILEHNVSGSDAFHAFILLSYNDQDSHLTYSVIPDEKSDCQISMSESFELTAPCPDARQSIFKRWEVLGWLNENTIVVRYDRPREKSELLADENARAMGFLTQTRYGKACLITKQQQNIPLPRDNE